MFGHSAYLNRKGTTGGQWLKHSLCNFPITWLKTLTKPSFGPSVKKQIGRNSYAALDFHLEQKCVINTYSEKSTGCTCMCSTFCVYFFKISSKKLRREIVKSTTYFFFFIHEHSIAKGKLNCAWSQWVLLNIWKNSRDKFDAGTIFVSKAQNQLVCLISGRRVRRKLWLVLDKC